MMVVIRMVTVAKEGLPPLPQCETLLFFLQNIERILTLLINSTASYTPLKGATLHTIYGLNL